MAAETENALKTKSIRILKFFLSSISAWPADELGHKLHWLAKCYRAYLPLQCSIIFVGMIHYMATYNMDYLHFGGAIATWLLLTMEIVRISIPLFKGYGEVVREFLMSFHLIHFKHKGNNYIEIHKVVEKASYYLTLYISVTMLLGCILFNLSPLYVNYRNGILSAAHDRHNIDYFEMSVYYSSPSFNPFEHFKLVTFLNFYFSYVCTICVCVMDLLVLLITLHIAGHILVLRKNLESISGPGKTKNLKLERGKRITAIQYETYSKEENEKIRLILKDCVLHHRFIVRFSEKMTNFFGFMLAVNYGFQLVTLCILLLVSTQSDLNNMIRFGPLTLIIFAQLIQISVIFEFVGTQSEKLPDALYFIPWECMDISNQRSVCIILHRMQTPIRVSALGMTTVGVTTMAGILKTTISYFAFLRSMNS